MSATEKLNCHAWVIYRKLWDISIKHETLCYLGSQALHIQLIYFCFMLINLKYRNAHGSHYSQVCYSGF